jgi:putative heme-binding domain-containing protein|tara:strand:+ start:124 stop:939 length:816 start_codon:yes stop_codon:yes gene_type:complete
MTKQIGENLKSSFTVLLTRCIKGVTAILILSALSAGSLAGVGEGQELYNAYCQICHGVLGEGQTMGKPLTDAPANRLADQELIDVITDGRAGTGMAAWEGSLSEIEIFDIASYIRNLQGRPALVLGDNDSGPSDDPNVIAGEMLFNGSADCATCHSYDEKGGSVGPSLDGLGSRLGDDALRQALMNPSASIVSGYGAKEVEQEDGTVVRGRFRNDSELAVQIQSEDGRRWVTYFKERVTAVRDLDESLMPDTFANLSVSEQEKLLAFLRSL